jgi:hypothetical protein
MQLSYKYFCEESLLFIPISIVYFTVRTLKIVQFLQIFLPMMNLLNFFLLKKNNSEDDLWSDDEGSGNEDIEITECEHEDDNDYEGEEKEGDGGSNGNDESDVTSSGGSGIKIRGRNSYEWSVNEPKRMGQAPRKNIVVVPPGNKGEA